MSVESTAKIKKVKYNKTLDNKTLVDYNENKKDDFDSFAPRVSDNFSFIKIEV